MTTHPIDDLLTRWTDDRHARPIPPALLAARRDVLAVVDDLARVPDDAMDRPWAWTGGSESEIRYGFYRIAEAFELAGIEADAVMRAARADRGRAAERIAPAAAARWDLHGLLLPVPAATWDADPGGGEWTIRRTVGHIIGGQRAYGIGTGWWLDRAYRADDLDRPRGVPDDLWDELPSDDTEAEGTPTEVLTRLGDVLDRATERLAGLPPDRLGLGAAWSAFHIDIDFRLGRWSSHIREHTVQVEKAFDMLGHQPTEGDRLIRLVLAAWGRAEAIVYGAVGADEAVGLLASEAAQARVTAADVAATGASPSST